MIPGADKKVQLVDNNIHASDISVERFDREKEMFPLSSGFAAIKLSQTASI
jgi:hypothetical protein